MKIRTLIIPQTIYQWTAFFFISILLTAGIPLAIFPLMTAFMYAITGSEYPFYALWLFVLNLYAFAFLRYVFVHVSLFFKKRPRSSLRYVIAPVLFGMIALPVAVVYILSGLFLAIVLGKSLSADLWFFVRYTVVPYKILDTQAGNCFPWNISSRGQGTISITTQSEYERFRSRSSKDCRYPPIDFTSQQILISSYSYGSCDSVHRTIYRDDRKKRFIHRTTIRPFFSRYIGGACTLMAITDNSAILVPNMPGYTVSFVLQKEE